MKNWHTLFNVNKRNQQKQLKVNTKKNLKVSLLGHTFRAMLASIGDQMSKSGYSQI